MIVQEANISDLSLTVTCVNLVGDSLLVEGAIPNLVIASRALQAGDGAFRVRGLRPGKGVAQCVLWSPGHDIEFRFTLEGGRTSPRGSTWLVICAVEPDGVVLVSQRGANRCSCGICRCLHGGPFTMQGLAGTWCYNCVCGAGRRSDIDRMVRSPRYAIQHDPFTPCGCAARAAS